MGTPPDKAAETAIRVPGILLPPALMHGAVAISTQRSQILLGIIPALTTKCRYYRFEVFHDQREGYDIFRLNETGGTNTAVEFYTIGSGWSTQYIAPWTPDLYPRLRLLPNRGVFHSGSQTTSKLFNPATITWSTNVAHMNYRLVSEGAHLFYKANDYHEPAAERTLAWNDPELNTDWRLDDEPIVSIKDQHGIAFRDAERLE